MGYKIIILGNFSTFELEKTYETLAQAIREAKARVKYVFEGFGMRLYYKIRWQPC